MNPHYAYQASDAAWDEAADRRMADLATFADGLVHDLRNPLNVIKSNLYLLRQRLAGTEEARTLRSLERIDDQVTAQERLLEGVQAFYRSDQAALQTVQVNEVVRRVAETTTPPEGCDLRMELAEGLPTVRADPHLLEAALRALVRNAIEAVAADGAVRILTAAEGDRVHILVEDSGPGIAPELLPQVFQPLFTTRRGHGGMGLALVARVAHAHGGRALVGSRPGSGTQAILELPGSLD